MSYRSLRDFMAKLEAAGELVRVSEPVSTVLEMTEIQTRLLAEGGPAVLFERPFKALDMLAQIFLELRHVEQMLRHHILGAAELLLA